MSEPGPSLSNYHVNEPIVVDDDDDDGVPMPPINHTPTRSPSASLREVTPAMSVATTSASSNDVVIANNGAGLNGDNGASALDRYRTGYVYSSDMMLHVNPIEPDHPERPLRIWKIYLKFKENNLFSQMKRVPIREVTKDEIKLVHDQGMWDGVERTAFILPDVLKCQTLGLESNSSLYVNEHSAYAAKLSCGGAIELCDAVASGSIQNGFAIVRPPGHHAEPQKSMGFCFYNNVAVATRDIMRRHDHINKVLILDWDVHHGNGTQRAFEADSDVLYVSLHRYDEDGSFYPGSTYGNYDSAGTGPGEGKSVNVPWPTHGMGDADYLYAFHNLIMPIAQEFRPDLVIVSAGFDAAEGDPIGLNRVTPGGFAQMTHLLTSLCRGKVAVVLEGGYNPDAVAESALAVTQVLLSIDVQEPRETVASSIAAATVRRVRRFHKKWWKSLHAPELEADDVDPEAANPPSSIDVTDLLAAYRTQVLMDRYDLIQVPLDHQTNCEEFQGDALSSVGILDHFSTIVFFIHDMGNWRSDRSPPSADLNQITIKLIDASRCILDYAQSRGYGIVDMNIAKEFATGRPLDSAALRQAAQNQDARHLDVARRTAIFLWDNIVALASAPGSRGPCNVVLVGFGTGCNVLASLIDTRNIKRHVHAIVNVVGYNPMPGISTEKELEMKKWYFRRAMVLAPADHRYLVQRGDAPPLKRYGKITPIHDTAVINILSENIGEIKAFIERRLNAPRRQ